MDNAKNRMKILYVIEDIFPPFRVDVVELFAKKISRNEYEIDWLMRSENDKDKMGVQTWCGQKVHIINTKTGNGLVGKLMKNIYSILFDFTIISIALKGKYDVIQVRDRYMAGLIAYCMAKVTCAKFIFWMSYPYPDSKIDQAKNRYVQYPALTYIKGQITKVILYKIVLKIADFIFVQSDEMLRRVSATGIPENKMTAIPMGIKDEVLEIEQRQKNIDIESPLLLYLGGISRIRKTEILVDVLHNVKNRYPNASLVYVGGGLNAHDEQYVIDRAKKRCVAESVTVTGKLSMDAAWEYVKRADICLSPINPIPTLLQASPTKLIEYMAFSKPIVANDHPEQTKILNESGVGDTVPFNAESFTKKIFELLESPQQTLKKAASGKTYIVKNHAYSVLAKKVMNIYKAL